MAGTVVARGLPACLLTLLLACEQESTLPLARSVDELQLARRSWSRAADLMPAFSAPVMAALHDKVVLVGSGDELSQSDAIETWEWDARRWQRRIGPRGPRDRLLPALARRGDALIMFGGQAASDDSVFPGALAETWRWDGSSWELLFQGRGPSARYGASAATLEDDRILLFGGQAGWLGLNDTWLYDDYWTPWSESGAPVNCVSPVAALGQTALIFCGAVDASEREGHTWVWDGAYWSEKQTRTRPSSRYGHALARFDDRVVMYGGYAESGNWQETWEWDGSDWHERTVSPSPPPRDGYQLVQQLNQLVLFGGGAGETWTWDGSRWSIAARAAMPAQRRKYAIGTLGDRAILFGGCCKSEGGGAAQYWDDTWTWDGHAWTELQTAIRPPPRAAATLAPIAGKLVLFGGVSGDQVLADTWELDGERWIERTLTSSPTARQGHAMAAYDGKVYVFGGAASAEMRADSLLGDMWAYDGRQWLQVFADAAAGTLPEPAAAVAMTSLGSQLVLFSSLSRLHIWDGSGWSLQEVAAQRAPYIVPESAIELPGVDGPRLLVAGKGYGPYTSSEWDGTAWSSSFGLSVVMGPLAVQGDTVVSLGGWPLRTWIYASR